MRGRIAPERLLDQAAFFLHRNVRQAARGAARSAARSCTSPTSVLAGKKVLIVDDDMRNIFALSTVLEEHGMDDRLGRQRPRRDQDLQTQPDIDIVLMDIMMPEMDGIDTMREIRKMPQLQATCRSSP